MAARSSNDCTWISASNSLAPELVREKALKYFDIENSLYKALKGWAPPVLDGDGNLVDYLCQPLNRMGDATEGRNDKLRVRVLHFSTYYQDDSAATYGQKATPGLQLGF